MDKIDSAKILKEDADLVESHTRKLELLADYHKLMSELTEGHVSARHIQDMNSCISELSGQSNLDPNPDVISHIAVMENIFSIHYQEISAREIEGMTFTPIQEKISELGIELIESDIGQTYRIQVNGILDEGKADFHIFQSSKDGEFTIKTLSESDETKIAAFVEYMTTPVCEDIEKYDAWKRDIESKYPEHAGKIRYVGKSDNGSNHISAQVPGQDRSFGFYDVDKNEGHVLSESVVDSADFKENEEGNKSREHHIEFKDEKSANKEPEVFESNILENLKEVDGKWGLFSRKDPNKVLQWYKGEGKPSEEWVNKVEQRIHMFEDVQNGSDLFSLEEGYDKDFKDAIWSKLDKIFESKFESIKAEIAKTL